MRLGPLVILGRVGLRRIVQFIIHLPNFIRLFFRLIKDPRVPPLPKLVPLAVLGYLIIPIDLLPDLVPALGQIDDAMIVILALRFFLKLCPKRVVEEHVRAIAAGK
jgi:uncharacterized membrane protein YkvA (DUF1232 family)